MRILVTGASGLLGINIALEASKQHTVIGVVHNTLLKTNAFDVIQTDLVAPGASEDVLEKIQPDWVIHCAALAVIDACEADPARAEQLNIELPAKLAKHVARGGARLLHISTDAVFDGKRGGYSEIDHPNPLSTYARTKLEGEKAVIENNPEAIIARTNLYGWSATGTRSLAEFFFNNLRVGKRINGFTDVFFCPILVNDLTHIFLDMLAANLSGLYHVVGSECLSKYDFGVKIARKFGFESSLITPISVNQSSLTASRSHNLTLSNNKVLKELNTSVPDLEAGLTKFRFLHELGYSQMLKGMVVKTT